MKFSHKTLILIAGLVWLVIGAWLLSLGIHFILETVRQPALTHLTGRFSITGFVNRFISDRTQAVMLCILLALFIGYLKGKMALAKSVTRQIKRIVSLPNPTRLKYLYSKGYYLLIASMILLGVMMRFLPITLDTRGFIDMIIGSALVNGAVLYYRAFSQYGTLKKRDI
jgi:hypothetical protein